MAMVGCGGSGKSTILARLELGEIATEVPTIGFPVDRAGHPDFSVASFQVKGASRDLLALWRIYFPGTRGLIFVHDASVGDEANDASRVAQRS